MHSDRCESSAELHMMRFEAFSPFMVSERGVLAVAAAPFEKRNFQNI